MDKELENKVALITGASSGIGKATAQVMSREGAKIVMTYFENDKGAEEVEESIKNTGGEVIKIKVDVTNDQDIASMFSIVKRAFGKIDILVNNAGGFNERLSLFESERNYWQRIIDINLSSIILVSKTIVPLINENGCIINISSIAAINGGGKGAYAYATSKGGIRILYI